MKKVIIDGLLRREKCCSCWQGSSSTTHPRYKNQDHGSLYGDSNAEPVGPDRCRNHYSTSSQFGTAFGHTSAPRSSCPQDNVFNNEARWGSSASHNNSAHHASPRHQTNHSGYHGSSSHHYPSSKFGPHATPSTSDHGMGYHMPAPDIG